MQDFVHQPYDLGKYPPEQYLGRFGLSIFLGPPFARGQRAKAGKAATGGIRSRAESL